ncbi:hypothetical protein M4578_15805 [Salipiger sp. P9]|uniref:hypothetical protein n=1 Tax=Salipiger pentaromativorans TaxID=2943193 RepID=UPI002157629E|nr:hypothetical protein [Salipiger pentaromativorans]MCR8549296.1 hypothetical protein [Salipiger pentaromativorans]
MTAKARMFGPFRVVTATGQDVTPKGQLRRAMLAVLLMSRDQICTRQSLIEMFWAESDPAKSAASLRTALSELRKDLAPLGPDCIIADRYSIRIDPDRITAGLAPSARRDAAFLEGIDLSLRGAEGFETWLRDQRLNQEPPPAEQALEPSALLALIEPMITPPAAVAIGLLPCRSDGRDPSSELSANLALDRFLDALSGVLALRLFDYRDNFGLNGRGGPELDQSNGPRLMIRASCHRARNQVSFQLLDTQSGEILWTGELSGIASPAAAAGATSDHDILRLVEELVPMLAENDGYGETEVLSPYQAIVSMFHLRQDRLDRLQTMLETAVEDRRSPIHHALLCYLSTIRTGEKLGKSGFAAPDAVRDLARDALRPDRFHAFSLSMSGYALTYLAGEAELGLDLAKKAVEIAPAQAFCWDQLALCLFSLGELDAGAIAAQRAQALGMHSPIRYTYDTTAAIIAFARSDYVAAAKYGNRALFRMPRFTSAIRYTAAAMAHLGHPNDGHRLVRQLQLLQPGTSTTEILDAGHLPRVAEFPERLTAGLKRAGLR